VHCGNKWAEISLLYWQERRPADPAARQVDHTFCPCGHTVACHLTMAEAADLERRSAAAETD